MSNKHELDNMIYSLKENKNLNKVTFTQSAVKKVLEYLEELSKMKGQNDEISILRKALGIASSQCHFCCSPPEMYDASEEYGSDKPYWIEMESCDRDNCNECLSNYFIQQAKKELSD